MVTSEEVRRVAELANLELTEDECGRMGEDLNAILGHIAQLNELDTRGVPAMAQVSDLPDLFEKQTRDEWGTALRTDRTVPSLDRKAVLACAPESDGRFFKVPKVIER